MQLYIHGARIIHYVEIRITNTFRPKRFFLNQNDRISIKTPLKFVHKGPIENIHELVKIMVLCRPGDKPLSEATMFNLLTPICVSRPR